MSYKQKRVTEKQIHTTDQKLLQEIRDELAALTLALGLRKEAEAAERLNAEIAEVNQRLERSDNIISLLGRVAGVHPEALSEDELELLADAGAWQPDHAESPA